MIIPMQAAHSWDLSAHYTSFRGIRTMVTSLCA
jgi:hypothetical protein